MRIVHVVENLERGGLERVVIDLARIQQASGHAVRVACLFRRGALAGELEAAGIDVHACGKRGGLDLAALASLRTWLRASRGGVLHTHNATAHYHAVAAAAGIGFACVANTRHGMGAADPRSRGEWLYRRTMRRTDVVAAVCEAARARFDQQGVRPRGVLATVPNGIRVERFAQASDRSRDALAGALGFEPGARLVGTVGRLNPVKDHATLLRAFARVLAVEPRAGLVVVGDGAQREPLEAQVRSLGIASRVRLLGDRGDVAELLPGLAVFALSSRSEGYSIALLEACAAGLPIVATDVGGNAEIVAEGRNGRLVPPQDDAALADALLTMLADADRAAGMGAAGRAWAFGEASLEAMAARYARLYAIR